MLLVLSSQSHETCRAILDLTGGCDAPRSSSHMVSVVWHSRGAQEVVGQNSGPLLATSGEGILKTDHTFDKLPSIHIYIYRYTHAYTAISVCIYLYVYTIFYIYTYRI